MMHKNDTFYKDTYAPGTEIEIIKLANEKNSMIGARAAVIKVNDKNDMLVRWRDGQVSIINPAVDIFKRIL